MAGLAQVDSVSEPASLRRRIGTVFIRSPNWRGLGFLDRLF